MQWFLLSATSALPQLGVKFGCLKPTKHRNLDFFNSELIINPILFSFIPANAFSSRDDVSSYNQDEDEESLQGGFLGLNFDTNRCKPNNSYIWCLPMDYNQEKHPFTCRYHCICIL